MITPTLLGELIAFHKDECMRYRGGRCLTLACLRRGGYVAPKAHDAFDEAVRVATCETHETVLALQMLQADLLEKLSAKEPA